MGERRPEGPAADHGGLVWSSSPSGQSSRAPWPGSPLFWPPLSWGWWGGWGPGGRTAAAGSAGPRRTDPGTQAKWSSHCTHNWCWRRRHFKRDISLCNAPGRKFGGRLNQSCNTYWTQELCGMQGHASPKHVSTHNLRLYLVFNWPLTNIQAQLDYLKQHTNWTPH